MSAHIRALKAKKAAALQKAGALNAITDRDLTADEQQQLSAHIDTITGLNAQIERAEFLAAQEAGMNTGGGVVVPAGATINVSDNRADDPTRGFRSFGEFARSVIGASSQGVRSLDERLRIGAAAPSTAANEGTGADGGFVVPPQYSADLFRLSLLDGALLPFTSNVNIDGNSMVFPKTEQTPWGTNGVRAYWQNEAALATATKPALGAQAMRLHKLMALVPLSDELAADQSALQSELPGLIGDSIKWKINEAILFGNGNGQPLGALASSGPGVVQAKDSGQAANTLSVSNLFNMLSRLPNPATMSALWQINPTVIPALASLVLGQVPVFLPGGMVNVGGIGQMPVFGTLLGRPVMISQHAKAFSAQGDVQLHDMSYYRTITKAEGIATATSLHLYFDADAMALRVITRIDGSPKIAAPISPANGSTTLSPFVQLQAR
jgi:HK97 family phage major capsid protein